MRETLERNRSPIGVAVLVVVLAVSFWLHHESTKPYFEVTAPYPAYDQKQVVGMCAFTVIRTEIMPLSYCRCVLEHIEANATVEQYKAVIADAKGRGQTSDRFTTNAFQDCNKRLKIKPLT